MVTNFIATYPDLIENYQMFRALLLIAALIFSMPVSAQCYSRAEAEAEQGLRIHSELMVIGLNCMGILKSPALYGQYQSFTRQNHAMITGWENTMIGYFDRNGGNGVTQFHDFRTRMANQISGDAARMRPDVFCHNHVRRLAKAMTMNSNDLEQWASTSYSNVPPSRPLCASAGR